MIDVSINPRLTNQPGKYIWLSGATEAYRDGDTVVFLYVYHGVEDGRLIISGQKGTELISYKITDWGGEDGKSGNLWFIGNDLTLKYEGFADLNLDSGLQYRVDGEFDDEHKIDVILIKSPGTYNVTIDDSLFPYGPDGFFHIWNASEEKEPEPEPVVTPESREPYVPMTNDDTTGTNGTSKTPETTKEDDGSTTTTKVTDNTDGSKTTETTVKGADGSETTTVTTENKDGSSTTEMETKNADGTVTTETVIEKADGSSTKTSETVDENGEVIRTVEESISTNKNGTEVVELKIENADGSSVESVVKTTTEGKVVSETLEVDAKGNLSVTLETDKPDGSEVVKTFEAAADAGLKLTDYDTKGSTAVVPGEIKIGDNTLTVTTIGKKAFAGNTDITKVKLPKSITVIGKGAFQGASNLATIELGSDITKVSKNAFKGIAKNAVIKIKASKKDFDRIVALIVASGIDSSVTFKRVKP